MCLVLGASSAWAQDAAPKPPSGRIAGAVVAMDTGKPIRWAQVRMVSQEGRQSWARTDVTGRFEFKELAAGAYRLDATAERYLRMYLGGQVYSGLSAVAPRPVTLRDGEQFVKADFALPRGGAIEGRLVDEFGDPAPGLVVQLSQVQFGGGRRRLMPVGGGPTPPTDDKGQFRLHGLAPGTYYISALSGAFAQQAETGGFAPTYYPGTTDITAAKPVRLSAGQELTNLTFPLIPARMARISGRVVNADGQPVARASLSLSVADSLGLSDFFIARGATETDGAFVFRNVPPGSFTLQGFGPPPAGGPLNLGAGSFGWLPLVVSGDDQAGLELRVVTGPSLRGRVSAEEAGAAFNPREVTVTAIPVSFDSAPVGGGPPPFTMQDDGAFEVKNMSGRRIVRVGSRNPAWTLKRITLNGREITDDPIDFTKGDPGEIDVVLTNRITTISGTVTDTKGNPVPDYSVVIFAADPAKWTDRSRFVTTARPSQSGGFTVRGLPPEEYYAIALPSSIGTQWQDPDFLKTLPEPATRLLLGDGESKTITLRLIEK